MFSVIDVDRIKIGKRVREEVGDLESLKRSIQTHGLIHPITVDHRYRLISGYRRLLAIKELGWEKVPVRVIDRPAPKKSLMIEIEENTLRKDLTDSEIEKAKAWLEDFDSRHRFFLWLRRWMRGLLQFLKRIFRRH